MANTITNREPNMLKSNSALLELPPEIRNQIMRLVLHPGHIYLHQKLTVNKRVHRQENLSMRRQEGLPARFSLESRSSNSGPEVLATCRQLYREWHGFYYSSNTFHIPTSSIMLMQPKHRALIRHVGLRLSLLDAIPSKNEEIETLARGLEKGSEMLMTINPAFKENVIYPLCFPAVLLGAWLSNISFIRESFPGLKTMCIEIRTQEEPQRLLRLIVPAKNVNSWTGYRFKIFKKCAIPDFTRLRLKCEEHRLDVNIGVFLDFAVHQAHSKVERDIALGTGTWAQFKDSVDADFLKKYDDEILGGDIWSWTGWSKSKEWINAHTETAEVV
ncbi:MAG: hypothetical protein HETSPECPRED_000629 [Heterodermia speciosa]|uniref:DUF7730 domain-containing protein n=1 Tax=Heterodermia speciosa TaxID=116794 RepID=A0A8H3G3Z8_9LECA|nr:MAG: hypothetical protein HETSPECPRED_000629 [Heterodermia speciosa]